MKYYITLKTEKHFQYIVEADNLDSAIQKAKCAATWYDFSDTEDFYTVYEECREATVDDVFSLRKEFILV